MNIKHIAFVCIAALAGCASPADTGPQEADRLAQRILKSSFRAQGIATLDRLNQDELQQACSGDNPPAEDVARRIEAAQRAAVQWPQDGAYLGDWREGEKLAQNGRGMTWSDPASGSNPSGTPGTSANGGNCYNCHQLTPAEISFGSLGPSLYRYGALHGGHLRGLDAPGHLFSGRLVTRAGLLQFVLIQAVERGDALRAE